MARDGRVLLAAKPVTQICTGRLPIAVQQIGIVVRLGPARGSERFLFRYEAQNCSRTPKDITLRSYAKRVWKIFGTAFDWRVWQPSAEATTTATCARCLFPCLRGAPRYASRFASDSRRWFTRRSPPARLTDRVLSESGARPDAPGRDRRGGKAAGHPRHG